MTIMIKRWILPALCGLLAVSAQADLAESAVPIPVVTNLKAAYPQAQYIEWDYDGDRGIYEAEFRIGRLEHELVLTAEGTIVLAKAEIPVAELPPDAAAAVRQRYQGGVIEKVKKITRDNSVRYKVEVQLPNGDVDIYVDPRGGILHEDR